MDLGRELKRWRLQHGLSKRALAKILRVSTPTLTRWEEGPSEPHDYNLHRILALPEGGGTQRLGTQAP